MGSTGDFCSSPKLVKACKQNHMTVDLFSHWPTVTGVGLNRKREMENLFLLFMSLVSFERLYEGEVKHFLLIRWNGGGMLQGYGYEVR